MNPEMKDAIERARGHLQNAALEALRAALSLIDIARAAGGARDAGGVAGTGGGGLADEVRSALGAWIANLEQGHPLSMPRAITEPLRRALETEIARWEERSASDESARPVLRAFLGLRELLWEMGLRSPSEEESKRETKPEHTDSPDADRPTTTHRRQAGSGKRVQRFHLED